MSIPKEPRQQMINLMYLFLTAMLALNVSAEILNAFSLVNEGLEVSIGAITDKNDGLLRALEEKKQDDKTAEDEYLAAVRVHKLTTEAIKQIQSYIDKIYEEVGVEEETGELKNPGNLEISTNYMVNKGHGEELKNLILSTRDSFRNIVGDNPAVVNNLTLRAEDPPAKEGEKKDWVEYNFYGIPAIAAVTLLTKIKTDFNSSESAVLEFLSSRVNASKFTFDVLTGRAISNKNIVNLGETYRADIFVSATSQSAAPKVYLGPLSAEAYDASGSLKRQGVKLDKPPLKRIDKVIEDSENGIVQYEVKTTSEGPKVISGVIEVKNPNTGEVTYYPFKEEYLVAKSMAVVSPEKMNVFYVGVDNPVSVSAPGYQHSQITAKIKGPGTITPRGEAGKYNVKITKAVPIEVEVYAKTDEGTRFIGKAKFRGKNIPTPDVFLGNAKGGGIRASEARAQSGIYALAEGFDFDVRFKIKSFEITYKKARQNNLITEKNNGPKFNDKITRIMRNVGPGDRLWFDDIKVAMPDGRTVPVNLSLKVF